MPDLIDGSENVSVHGIFNWILLLAIFSIITVIGNSIGFNHPMVESLIVIELDTSFLYSSNSVSNSLTTLFIPN